MQILTEWITGCMIGIEWATFPLEGYQDDIGMDEFGDALIMDFVVFRLILVW